MLSNFLYLGITSEQWWHGLVKKVLSKENLNENLIKSFSNHIYHEFKKETYWQKYENCELILEKLKKKNYILGIISNFDERLEVILKNMNIDKYFNFILIPSKCNGYSKPDKNVFLEAFRLGGGEKSLKSKQYLHIGDSLDLDYKPAVNLGFRSLLMLHSNLKQTHNNLDSASQDLKNLIQNNLYANNLLDLYDKIIQL